MKASELRIGNIIYYHGTMTYVYQLDSGGVTACQINDIKVNKETGATLGTGGIDFTPIPITEEWLVKFGFEPVSVDPEFWHMNYIVFSLSKGYLLSPFDTYAKIGYVHQLQNLYFALTGKELEIKAEQSAQLPA